MQINMLKYTVKHMLHMNTSRIAFIRTSSNWWTALCWKIKKHINHNKGEKNTTKGPLFLIDLQLQWVEK